MRYRPLALAFGAIAFVSGCEMRPTGDGGIAVVPIKDSPINVTELVTQPAEPETEASAPAEDECSAATVVYGDWLAGSIKGTTPGSKVNVRPAPDLSTTSGSYGLVGDEIEVMGEAIAVGCDRWFHVHFPQSGHRGYVSADFVAIQE